MVLTDISCTIVRQGAFVRPALCNRSQFLVPNLQQHQHFTHGFISLSDSKEGACYTELIPKLMHGQELNP
jgi:hypothetical protein